MLMRAYTHDSVYSRRNFCMPMRKTKLNNFLSTIFPSSQRNFDRLFLAIVIALATYGTIMVFSAGYAYADFRYGDGLYFVKRQAAWLVIGVLSMLAVAKIDVGLLEKHTSKAYLGTLLLLGLTLAIGFVGNGAQRWIAIGPITIQPSEIAKLTMTMMLAKYFSSSIMQSYKK